MRSCVALVAACGSAIALGSAVLAQDGATVFAPVPAQGGVAAPAVPGGPAIPLRDRGRTAVKGTASIRGRITAAGSNMPLRRAQVLVTAADGAARYTTTTDGDGRYEVLDLVAGRYGISVSKGGYVTLQYGQRRPFEAGTPVTLADAQAMTGLNVALPKGSVIAGRITDEFGEPVAQAQVSAQRYQYGPDGQRRLQPTGIPVTTDDLGQFRLHSLMPGEYVVSASFRNMFVAPLGTAGGDTSEGFLPTFHPGTVNANEAQPVTVTLGQESQVQFALSAARMARVSGVVVDSTGRALANGIVMLMPSSGVVSGMLTTAQITTDGAFSVANVAPGDYVLNVQPMGAFAAADRAPETAAVPLSVGGADINGIRVVTSAGTLLSGRVEFEGTSSRTTPLPWRVFAQPNAPGPAGFGVGLGPANGSVAEDGAFQLQVSASAAMLLRVAGSPAWTMKAVLLDGEDVTDTPLDWGKGSVTSLRIVMTDRLTTVSGRVVDSRGRPLTDYAVIIQPEEAKTGVVAARYLRLARPDQSGSFRVTGLPPGRYAATAVETFEQGRQFVPEVQARLKERAKTFSLDEGGTATLDLPLTPGVE
jgi:hypothetical protein